MSGELLVSVLLDNCVLRNKIQVKQMVKKCKGDMTDMSLMTNTEKQDLKA